MPGNALRHVLIPCLCGGHKEDVIPTQLLGEPLCVGTFTAASSSQDQEQAPHTSVSSVTVLRRLRVFPCAFGLLLYTEGQVYPQLWTRSEVISLSRITGGRSHASALAVQRLASLERGMVVPGVFALCLWGAESICENA